MPTIVIVWAGMFLIWLGLCRYRHRSRVRARAMATLAWPRAPGRVTASWIGNTTMPGGYEFPTLAYEPQVSYSYEVAGTTYHGVRISFAEPTYATKKRAADIVARYPAGAEVQIAYDAANPKESVLVQSLKGTSPVNFDVIIFCVGGVAVIGFALLL